VEEFAAGGVVEELGVGLFGDGGGCVAEEFADDFEAEAVVEEVAAEGAAQRVGADVGFVVAVLVLGAAGLVGRAEGVAAAGAGAHVGAVGEAFDESPGEAWAHGGAVAAAQQRDCGGVEVVAGELVEPLLEEGLEFGEDRDRAPTGWRLAPPDGERLLSGGEVEVGEGDVAGFADAQAAPAQEGDEEAFLEVAGAAEEGVVFGGAQPVVFDRLGFGRLDLAHRVGARLAALVGDQVEAVEVGVEGPEGVDLGAVAGACGRPAVADLEVPTPVLEVAIDLACIDVAGGALAEPAAVGGERFSVFATGAGGSGLPGEVGVERR